MSEGKIDQLIKQKRVFLRQALKDYSAGGNDMLDDVESLLKKPKQNSPITWNSPAASKKKKVKKLGKKNASPCLRHGTRNGLENPNLVPNPFTSLDC